MKDYSLSLAELAKETECTLIGDPDHLISGVSELNSATSSEAAFIAEKSFLNALQSTKAGVIFIEPRFARVDGLNYLLSSHPALAFQRLSKRMAKRYHSSSGFEGVHPSAVIHHSAQIGTNTYIGPNAVIEQGVEIGENCYIGALVYLGPNVKIGRNTAVHPNASIHGNTQIGERVVICSGAVVGSIGFGFYFEEGSYKRYEHLGCVRIEDDVEIGANTTIDRARLQETVLEKGTKIDNQVQIAHNCKVGKHNLIVSQVGIAGSAKTGDYVTLAGRVCVNGHISICSRVTLAACSAVLRDIATPGSYMGFPAISSKRYQRLLVSFLRLDRLFSDVDKIKKNLKIDL